jgi:hypothetical protein
LTGRVRARSFLLPCSIPAIWLESQVNRVLAVEKVKDEANAVYIYFVIDADIQHVQDFEV